MNPAQSIDKLWSFMTGLAQSLQVCFGGGYGAADCDGIWKIAILAIVIVAVVVVWMVSLRIVRNCLRHIAAIMQWRADRVVASKNVMDEVRWNGDKAGVDIQTHQELAAQIKEGLRQNRDSSV